MKQTIVLKLQPTPRQQHALLETLEAFNAGCQYVADVAFQKRCANKLALQPVVYGQLRNRFRLSSQMAIRCIAKAVDAYKRDRSKRVQLHPHGAMVYDQRNLSFKGVSQVSLLCLSGREVIPLRFGEYQAARMERVKGQCDLIYRQGRFFLYATIDLPPPPLVEANEVLGVDLGIVNIAVDSDGEAHTGQAVRCCRRRNHRHRRLLQKKRTKAAFRRLCKIRRRESRFVSWVNHNISKHIVQKARASQRAIALEDLKGIRERVSVRKSQRYERMSWAFHQLGQFFCYKAEAAGISVVFVDPAYTSRTCPSCGHCSKSNRKTQSAFVCERCGFQADADVVGATNIRRKALEARGLVTGPNDGIQPLTA